MNKTTLGTCLFGPLIALGMLVLSPDGGQVFTLATALFAVVKAAASLAWAVSWSILVGAWAVMALIGPVPAGITTGLAVRKLQNIAAPGHPERAAVCGVIAAVSLILGMYSTAEPGLYALILLALSADFLRDCRNGFRKEGTEMDPKAPKNTYWESRRFYLVFTPFVLFVAFVIAGVLNNHLDTRGRYDGIAYTLGMSPEDIRNMDEKFDAAYAGSSEMWHTRNDAWLREEAITASSREDAEGGMTFGKQPFVTCARRGETVDVGSYPRGGFATWLLAQRVCVLRADEY